MVKRTKIIMIVGAIVIALSFVYFVMPPQIPFISGDGVDKLSGLEALKTDMKEGLKKSGMDKVTNYVITKAESLWDKNVFMGGGSKNKSGGNSRSSDLADPEKMLPTFIYSGFLEVGDKRISVIDGNEFVVGQILQKNGFTYKIESIEPNWVMIEDQVTHEKRPIYFSNPFGKP